MPIRATNKSIATTVNQRLYFNRNAEIEASDMFGCYSYTVEQVYWKANTNNKPIIIKRPDDFKLFKEYINVTLIQYKTSLSSKL